MRIVSTLSVLFVAAAPAFADEGKCPFTDELHGWSDVDDTTIVIDIGASRYKVSFIAPCREARETQIAKVVSRPGICLSPGDSMVFRSAAGTRAICVIKAVEKSEAVTPSH